MSYRHAATPAAVAIAATGLAMIGTALASGGRTWWELFAAGTVLLVLGAVGASVAYLANQQTITAAERQALRMDGYRLCLAHMQRGLLTPDTDGGQQPGPGLPAPADNDAEACEVIDIHHQRSIAEAIRRDA